MKIFFLITRGNQGGAQTNVLSLAKEAVAGGHEVRIGTGKEGWLATEAGRAGIPVVFFRALQRSWNPLQPFKLRAELQTELHQRPADILHMHSSNALFGVLATRRIKNGPKLVATVHGLSVLNPGWRGNPVVRFIYTLWMRYLWRRCDRLIFVCQSDLDYVLLRGLAHCEQCRVVLNGINSQVEYFTRERARHELGLMNNDQAVVVGTVARLDYQKDIDLFLRVVGALRNQPVIFRIIGEGPDRSRLQEDIKSQRLTDHVQIHPQARNGYKYMPAFDLFLMTSRYEGLPYTLLEAGLAGLPVVSVDVDGVREIVRDGVSGVLVKERTPQLLANAIKCLIDNEASRRSMGGAAQCIIKTDFSEQKMAELTFAVYPRLNDHHENT
ncbi:glycosyltransferase [Patescibacteria group bacterium]|nr:glycosyltransferase [Patescibacteria group bacterium]